MERIVTVAAARADDPVGVGCGGAVSSEEPK
jgi:hypothetical protein